MKIIISPGQAGMRLDAALRQAMPDISRSRIKKAIQAGYCVSAGASLADPDLKVRAGQEICLTLPDEGSKIQAIAGELAVLHADEDIAVCGKPAGLAMHPCPSCAEETLAHRLLAAFPGLAAQGGERPGIVHRLDRDTSGLIIVALSERAKLRLARDFAARRIKKTYLALVAGKAEKSGHCELAIGRHPRLKTRMAIVPPSHGGRCAVTEWERVWSNDRISLLAVRIHTGRTHQIRVHLASQGLPVIGDAVYGAGATKTLAPRQMLHAWRLAFNHPASGAPMRFTLPPPEDFFSAVKDNCAEIAKIVVTGNQGCGKSSFCADLAGLGLPVISADQIVAELYQGKSEATEWIGRHISEEAITESGSVDKKKLFALLEEKPDLRRELERVVHGLVLEQIEKFWAQPTDGPGIVAEIPLYFESGFAALIKPAPLVVGVSCPKDTRWQRIAATRGWDQDKIATMESWQWPEERKMAACDYVVSNNGGPEELAAAAQKFLIWLKDSQSSALAQLMERLREFCAGGEAQRSQTEQRAFFELQNPS